MSPGTNNNRPIKLLIVDDHPVVLGGLRAAFSSQPDINLVGEAKNGVEAEEWAEKLLPDVIVMDINMPERNGLEAMLIIKERLPDVKMIFLTVSESEEDLMQALRFGADGYLLKKSDIDEVIDSVRKVFRGEAILSQQMTSKLLLELKRTGREPILSERENDVLHLVGEGLTVSEIAEKLFISKGSVSTYIHRLLVKLHLKNKIEAMAYSLRHRK